MHKNKSKLVIGHINICSIRKKQKQIELNNFLKTHEIDIMSLNETHLKLNNNFQLDNYKIIRRDRPIKNKGGVSSNNLQFYQI